MRAPPLRGSISTIGTRTGGSAAAAPRRCSRCAPGGVPRAPIVVDARPGPGPPPPPGPAGARGPPPPRVVPTHTDDEDDEVVVIEEHSPPPPSRRRESRRRSRAGSAYRYRDVDVDD